MAVAQGLDHQAAGGNGETVGSGGDTVRSPLICCRFSAKTIDAIDKLAQRLGPHVTRSDVVRMGITALLGTPSRRHPIQSLDRLLGEWDAELAGVRDSFDIYGRDGLQKPGRPKRDFGIA